MATPPNQDTRELKVTFRVKLKVKFSKRKLNEKSKEYTSFGLGISCIFEVWCMGGGGSSEACTHLPSPCLPQTFVGQHMCSTDSLPFSWPFDSLFTLSFWASVAFPSFTASCFWPWHLLHFGGGGVHGEGVALVAWGGGGSSSSSSSQSPSPSSSPPFHLLSHKLWGLMGVLAARGEFKISFYKK